MARGLQKIQSQQRTKEKEKKGANSTLKVNAAALTIQCKVCMQTFLCTTKEPELKVHQESKHAKKTFADCFPGFGAAA